MERTRGAAIGRARVRGRNLNFRYSVGDLTPRYPACSELGCGKALSLYTRQREARHSDLVDESVLSGLHSCVLIAPHHDHPPLAVQLGAQGSFTVQDYGQDVCLAAISSSPCRTLGKERQAERVGFVGLSPTVAVYRTSPASSRNLTKHLPSSVEQLKSVTIAYYPNGPAQQPAKANLTRSAPSHPNISFTAGSCRRPRRRITPQLTGTGSATSTARSAG